MERVARELATQERVQGQGHLLGGQEEAVVQHRAAHVEHDDGGRLGLELGAEHLEVAGGEPHRGAGPVPLDRVHQGLLQVEEERVAELVGLGVVRAVAARPAVLDGVTAEAVALEVPEDVLERLVADLADGARGEAELIALPLEVPGLFQLPGYLAEALEIARRLRAQ